MFRAFVNYLYGNFQGVVLYTVAIQPFIENRQIVSYCMQSSYSYGQDNHCLYRLNFRILGLQPFQFPTPLWLLQVSDRMVDKF